MTSYITKPHPLLRAGKVGAILAGAGDRVKEALGQYGLNLGIAFQLIDDALDYSSTSEEFGKEVGQDLYEGKVTLPLIYALQKASAVEKKRVKEILLQGDGFRKEEFDFVFNIVQKYRGVERTKLVAKKFSDKGKEAISGLPQNAFKESLFLLADYITERKK